MADADARRMEAPVNAEMTGRVRSVDTVEYGDLLDGDHAIGVTTLQLQDAADFDEDGGYLRLNGVVLTYTEADLDLDTVTLADPLAVAALDGDAVSSWDPVANAVSSDLFALVAVDGTDTADDALEAIVDHPLAPLLPEGIRGTTGEAVELRYRGDDLFVTGIRGRAPLLPGYVNDDTSTWSGLGDLILTLTKTPKPGSLQIKLNGHELETTDWTYDAELNRVTVSSTSWMEAGATLTAYYSYDATIVTPVAQDYIDAVLSFSPLWFGIQDEATGSVLVDHSGNTGRDGTYNGVTLGATQIVPNLLGSHTAATYSGAAYANVSSTWGSWINTAGVAWVGWYEVTPLGTIQALAGRSNLVTYGSNIFSITAANKLKFEVTTGAGSFSVTGGTPLVAGVYMLSAIYDGSTVEVFVNAASDGSAAASGALSTSGAYGPQIGALGLPGFSLSYFFTGRIGPVAMFDPATFSRSDVPTLYNAGAHA